MGTFFKDINHDVTVIYFCTGLCMIKMYFNADKHALTYNCQEHKIEQWIRLWFKYREASCSNLKLDRCLFYSLLFCAI